jgi:hypothetical protein
MRKVFEAPAVRGILEDEQFPGSSVQTDEEIRSYILKRPRPITTSSAAARWV